MSSPSVHEDETTGFSEVGTSSDDAQTDVVDSPLEAINTEQDIQGGETEPTNSQTEDAFANVIVPGSVIRLYEPDGRVAQSWKQLVQSTLFMGHTPELALRNAVAQEQMQKSWSDERYQTFSGCIRSVPGSFKAAKVEPASDRSGSEGLTDLQNAPPVRVCLWSILDAKVERNSTMPGEHEDGAPFFTN